MRTDTRILLVLLQSRVCISPVHYKVSRSGGLNVTPDRERVITGDRGVTCWRVLLTSPPGVETMLDLGVAAGERIWPGVRSLAVVIYTGVSGGRGSRVCVLCCWS